MNLVWGFIINYEFWFLMLIAIGLEVTAHQTGETLMGSLGTLIGLTAIVRLAYHPVWKKDKQ